jgi:hypothetical protein
MTSKAFSDNKQPDFKGIPATHYTHESAKHCSWMEGTFKTNPIEAAKEYFKHTFHDSDGYDMDYIDGEDLLKGIVEIKIYELVQQGNKYYWNGNIRIVKFLTTISVDFN